MKKEASISNKGRQGDDAFEEMKEAHVVGAQRKRDGIRNDVEEVGVVKEPVPFLPTQSSCFPFLKR